MTSYAELIDLIHRGTRRYHLIGSQEAGIVAGLDLAGRLYAVVNGKIVNRVNPAAFLGQSTQAAFLNPGGDGLWPAPEGTIYGYEYATGAWRVPPGLTGARYLLAEEAADRALIRAEIDLINSQGLGIPTAFERDIRVANDHGALVATVTDRIHYLGPRTLSADQALLAPWSLCQFDSGPGCEVVFPAVDAEAIRDLYDPSDQQRSQSGDLWSTRTDASARYQIGLDARVEWIEFRDPRHGLTVRRTADPLPSDYRYIDIVDAPPDQQPSPHGVRFSVYSDTAGFMEIEAAGGNPETWESGASSEVTHTTTYTLAT